MNLPPSTYLRVAHTDLQAFIAQMGQTVGLPTEKAELLAEMLTANDLRGVFSHGTTQMATYARLLRELLPVPRDPGAPLQPRLDLPQGVGSPRPLSPAAGAPANSPIAQPTQRTPTAP